MRRRLGDSGAGHPAGSYPPVRASDALTERDGSRAGVHKGVTSFSVHREFPHQLKLPSMWTRSDIASTAGNVSQQTIQRYMAA